MDVLAACPPPVGIAHTGTTPKPELKPEPNPTPEHTQPSMQRLLPPMLMKHILKNLPVAARKPNLQPLLQILR